MVFIVSPVSGCSVELMLAVVAVQVSFSVSATTYQMSLLVNVGVSQPFAVANMADCVNRCTNNVSAVSYSKYNNQCVISLCPSLKVTSNALWDTTVCISPLLPCSLPSPPMFEWIMTDACGFGNNGWVDTDWTMQQFYDYNVLTSKSYTPSVNTSFGKSVVYPSTARYFSIASSAAALPLTSLNFVNGFTVFTYVYLTAPSDSFTLAIFGVLSTSGFSWKLELWVLGNQFYYNIVDNCTGNCINVAAGAYTAPTQQWLAIAAVYNSIGKSMNFYVNSVLNCTVTGVNINGLISANSVTIAARNGYGQFSGTMFCFKLFQSTLSAAQLSSVARSCSIGQLLI